MRTIDLSLGARQAKRVAKYFALNEKLKQANAFIIENGQKPFEYDFLGTDSNGRAHVTIASQDWSCFRTALKGHLICLILADHNLAYDRTARNEKEHDILVSTLWQPEPVLMDRALQAWWCSPSEFVFMDKDPGSVINAAAADPRLPLNIEKYRALRMYAPLVKDNEEAFSLLSRDHQRNILALRRYWKI